MSETRKYLAYGSNLHPLRLRERKIAVELVEAVALPGWRLEFHKIGKDGSAKCSISPSCAPHAVVWCALYLIQQDSIVRLDRIEGYGSGYDKTCLELDGHGTAYAYVASPGAISQTLRPFSWYRELVVAGALYHSFPEPYIRRIRETDAAEDPDRSRAAKHTGILRQAPGAGAPRLTSGGCPLR